MEHRQLLAVATDDGLSGDFLVAGYRRLLESCEGNAHDFCLSDEVSCQRKSAPLLLESLDASKPSENELRAY